MPQAQPHTHRTRRSAVVIIVATTICFTATAWADLFGGGRRLFDVSRNVGDENAFDRHLDQSAIEAGRFDFNTVFEHGKALFVRPATSVDGQGRPNHNGVFPPLNRQPRFGPENFNRISAPDADSCSGCHNKPRDGGGGDNVANVFVLGQRFSFFDDPAQPDENGLAAPLAVRGAADERNTLGMFGSGAVEMLAREMTTDLQAQRQAAIATAQQTSQDQPAALAAKGVSFGTLVAHPDGTVDTTGVEGVNADLIIRPFHQKGVVVSLREFTNNAFPHHHGLQPVERFGAGTDSDGDGVVNELSVGDITATTIYQAALGVPGQVIPRSEKFARAIRQGEATFMAIGCGTCHRPELTLNSPLFVEPNPFNPAGNLRPADTQNPVRFDMTREGELPRLQRRGQKVVVRAFTDLKRHNLGDHPLINNERVVQGGVPTNVFITKKLWGFFSEPHFLHNGRATTISEAILAHGGEALGPRTAFAGLSEANRRNVVEFLKSLRILPKDSRALVVDEFGQPVTAR